MDANHTQSADEIMRETEKTRAKIKENLDSLERRVSPDEVLDQVGKAIEPARDGTVRFAHNLGAAVRENPIPAAMVGIGLGWLLISGRRSEGTRASTDYGEPTDRVDPSRPADGSISENASDAVRERVRETKDWARKRSEAVREKVSDTADTAYRRASNTAYRASAQISDGSASVGNFVQKRPVLTGVAVAGVGAVIAAALFARTDRGKVVMSRASEAVGDGSHRMSKTVRSTAADVSEAAAETVSKAGERLDDTLEKTRRGADNVREAAQSRTEDALEKVREIAQKTKSDSTDADDFQTTSGRTTRSVAEQTNPGTAPDEVDDLKPVAVKPVPVSPPPAPGDRVSPAGVGTTERHATEERDGSVSPGSQPGTTANSKPGSASTSKP